MTSLLSKRALLSLAFSMVIAGFSAVSNAGTIVRISTSIGDYSIELTDEQTPLTVQNFLNYVNRNDYNGTYLHRVVNDFVVQGGGFGFRTFEGPIPIVTDPPVVNEFAASNTRGTVAMAKIDGDPNSATSQWFVNIADNSANLDNSNGGFTVFGNVLGDGLVVLDAIDDLPFVSLGARAPNAPYITPNYTNGLDFVYINAEVVERFSGAPHVYEVNSGLLITTAMIDGESMVSLNMDTLSSGDQVILQANPESVIRRRDGFAGIATFATADNRLRIPQLEVNDGGVITIVSDVVFVLTDPVNNLFTLESFAQ